MTVGRNDPCPCGSGKKYKKCCLQKDEQEAKVRHTAPNPFEEDEEMLPFDPSSFPPILTEMPKDGAPVVDALFSNNPNRPQDSIRLCFEKDAETYLRTPVMIIATALLRLVEEAKSVQLSEQGEFPIETIRGVYLDAVMPVFPELEEPPKSAETAVEVVRLRAALEIAGYLERNGTAIVLGKKGSAFLADATSRDSVKDLYRDLLHAFIDKFNWIHRTYYTDVIEQIQHNVLLDIAILRKRAKTWINTNRLAEAFIEAMPFIVEKSNEEKPAEVLDDLWDGELQVRIAFYDLFLQMFCRYFGFVDAREAPLAKERELIEATMEVKTSELFSATVKRLL